MADYLINLKDEARKDYSIYFFDKNPFPSLTVPEEDPRITADRHESIKQFKDKMNGLRLHDESSVMVFVGEYGSGKSHLLRVFSSAVIEQLDNPKDGVFPILIKSPGRNFLDYFIEAINGIGLSRMVRVSNQIVEDYIKKNPLVVKQLVDNDMKPRLEKHDYELEELLEHSQKLDLFDKIRKDTLKDIKESDLAYALLFLSPNSTRSLAWNWFFGSTLNRDDKSKIKIIDSNNDSRRAKMFLKDFANILEIIRYKYLAFFIDEYEKISILSTNQGKIFQDDIRDIIDTFPKRVAMFFAVAIHPWRDMEKETTALMRRLQSNVLELTTFNESDITELIQKYIGSFRSESNTNKIKSSFPNCQVELAPFTSGAITTIFDESTGIVSDVLEKCRKIIEYGVEINEKEITKKTVKKALKS